MRTIETDCLIIGTGLSGGVAAMEIAERGRKVVLITRAREPEETASAYAQGGIVFRAPGESSAEALQKDILEAGAGVGYPEAIRLLAQDGPRLVQEILLDRLGVPFDRSDDGSFDLTEEGAHSFHRILHCGDHTGREIERAVLRHLTQKPNVVLLPQHCAIDLLTPAHHSERAADAYLPTRCLGAYVLRLTDREVVTILSRETILATGGLGQLYLHTTNPAGARGDGLAMAFRTGARIMNLEYVQFHPTAFYQKSSERFLVTEAMRGEGARLYNQSGEEFMNRYDPRGTLAPRDVVSRAIHDEMLREGSQWVLLDISHKPAPWIRSRFPAVCERMKQAGIDITTQPIPVVPAAHYSCGGIHTDLDGATTIRNLRAVGEVACTGVHGANRLASTSLLEAVVWGVRAGRQTATALEAGGYEFPPVREWKSEKEPTDPDLLIQDWLTIKHTMWNYVGLIRTPRRLERARRILRGLSNEVQQFYARAALSDELIGLRNGAMAAQLILTAALRNRQSTGCHFVRTD